MPEPSCFAGRSVLVSIRWSGASSATPPWTGAAVHRPGRSAPNCSGARSSRACSHGLQSLPASLALAVVLWVGFLVVLLTGSIVWERVAPITATIHAGDWLLKLLLLAVITGLLH
jgi:Protein of unknown function (DUF1761)